MPNGTPDLSLIDEFQQRDLATLRTALESAIGFATEALKGRV
jgi:hypothetical protein